MGDMDQDTRGDLDAKAAALGVVVRGGLRDDELRSLLYEQRRQNALATLKGIGVKAKASQTLEELEQVVIVKKLGDGGDPMNLPPCHSLRVLPQGYAENPVLDVASTDCRRCIDLETCRAADPRYAVKSAVGSTEELEAAQVAGSTSAVGESETEAVQQEQESGGDWKDQEDGSRTMDLGDGGVLVDETTRRNDPGAAVAAGTDNPGEDPAEESDMSKAKKGNKKRAAKSTKSKKGAAKSAKRAKPVKTTGQAVAAAAKVRKARGEKANGVPSALADPRVSKLIGTTLKKSWRQRGGSTKEIEVAVKPDGFYYEGTKFGSLSQIAKEITGVARNGPEWFGLNK